MSGLADLGHGMISHASGKNYRKEYKVLISNNAAPAENRFSRSKSISEFEEDNEVSFSDATHFFSDNLIPEITSILYKEKIFGDQFRHLDVPIFLIHRQIIV
jgi:hypothetical protein